MNMEIERKFLVKNETWKNCVENSFPCKQGYISSGIEATTVRVRIMGNKGFLTIKGKTSGISRSEFEYEIPVNDAEVMLAELCKNQIVEKTRHIVKVGKNRWEIDEFHGKNSGLVIAEIELESEDQSFEKPGWIGSEVSHDPRYRNSALANTTLSS